MALKIGIDVGGTFTDFVVTRDGAEPAIFKSLSTPADPSIAVVNGLADIAVGNLTVTPERQKTVDFVSPASVRTVDEIVVTGPASPPLAS